MTLNMSSIYVIFGYYYTVKLIDSIRNVNSILYSVFTCQFPSIRHQLELALPLPFFTCGVCTTGWSTERLNKTTLKQNKN